MKLLVDAQLPLRLADFLTRSGHDVLHTTALPNGNRTPDTDITRIADNDDRIVVTKDADFVDSHLVRGAPRRLLVVRTGNITNDELIDLFRTAEKALVEALTVSSFVEVSREAVTAH